MFFIYYMDRPAGGAVVRRMYDVFTVDLNNNETFFTEGQKLYCCFYKLAAVDLDFTSSGFTKTLVDVGCGN